VLRSEGGFTLIELIIVIAILAIITAIVIPSVSFGINEARKSTDRANAKVIADAIQQVITADNDVGRVDITSPIVFEADVPDATADEIEKLIEYAAANIQSTPLVKYGSNNGSNFYVTIGSVSGLEVYVDSDGAGTMIKLYPKPMGEWAN
jgi:prepilin-type N-terminal cleavage/methylation domain-containing protein